MCCAGRTWHDRRMTDQEARYDRIAEGYAAWWSPVHRPGTLGLLDEVLDHLYDEGVLHRPTG